jgi:16S rRNA G1207 methylase RsmC
LEQLTRRWDPGWSLVDLGTGSGILALAAKRFGAGRVIGIDNDPAAISVAKSNARLNKIRGASFQLGDVHKWSPAQKTDVTTANLYSALLIEILPKLRGGAWLILSGILRSQQDELVHALQRNHLDIINMKRRGKWIAILARRGQHSATAEARARKFLRRSQTAATVKTDAIRTACLCHCHTLFDAEIAHRRHRWPVDFPHGTRFGRRPNVRSGRRASQALRRHDCDGN